MATRKVTWLYYADEMAKTPDLLEGMGFAVVDEHDSSITVDVYDWELGGDPGRVCSVYVKWDGCSSWSSEPDDKSLHLCGANDWAKTMDLIRRGAFKLAAEHMTSFDPNLANWIDDRPLVEVGHDVRDTMPEEVEA